MCTLVSARVTGACFQDLSLLQDGYCLFFIAANLHCELQSLGEQRWHEPVCPTAVPIERDLQKQCGGRHGGIQSSAVQAWRETRPLCKNDFSDL